MPNVERCLKCAGQGYRLDPVVFDRPEKCTACDGSGVRFVFEPITLTPAERQIVEDHKAHMVLFRKEMP